MPWRTRVAALTALVIMGGFALVDASWMSRDELLSRTLIRLAFTLVYVLLMAAASRVSGARSHAVVLALAFTIAFELGAVGLRRPPEESVGFFPAMLFFTVFLPLPLPRTVTMNALFVLGFVCTQVLFGHAPAGALFKHGMNLVAAGGIGVVAATMAERLQRSEFDARKSLAAASQRVSELLRVKDQFFADISHELRTPLTVALLSLEKEGEQQGAVRPLRRLRKLVDEMLELSRMDAGFASKAGAPEDLASLIRELVEDFTSGFTSKGLALSAQLPDQPERVAVPLDALEKIAVNLIGNALKYTPSGGQVRVAVREEGAEVVLEVSDDGPGIAPGDLPHIFERFVRVESLAGAPGSGIGLALAKELTELYGGRISCESEQAKGAVFRARWPRAVEGPIPRLGEPASLRDPQRVGDAAAAAVDGASGESQPQSAPADAPLVLVIEDHQALAARIAAALGPSMRTVLVHDGQAALQTAQAQRPDLVICDVLLPGLHGHEVVRSLREQPSTRDVPILVLSALTEREHVLEGLRAGADDTMGKPFDGQMLRARVDALLRTKKRRADETRSLDLLRLLCRGVALSSGYDSVLVLGRDRDQLAPLVWAGDVEPPSAGWGKATAPWAARGVKVVEEGPEACNGFGVAVAAPLGHGPSLLVALSISARPIGARDLESLGAVASLADALLDREKSLTSLAQVADEKRRLSAAVLKGQDSERHRLALELHDGAGQTLVGALMHLDLQLVAAKDRQGLVTSRNLIAQALADLRAVAYDLHPPALALHGLPGALEKLRDAMSSELSEVTIAVDPGLPEIAPATALGLFRIAQAALTNVASHSRALKTALRLRHLQGEVVLEVEDNGVGFLVDRTEHGVGLLGMRERAASLGGQLAIESDIGRGTLVRAAVPLAALQA